MNRGAQDGWLLLTFEAMIVAIALGAAAHWMGM